ncbi:MATH domain and coiled-coil domain-containing protein [Drosera capensis]
MASSHGSIYSFKVDDASSIIRSVRDEKPAHYLMEIESFTEFKDSIEGEDDDYLESMEFVAAGHTWVLVIYPHGNTNIGEEDHISLYLKLISKPRGFGWTVNAIIKFFIFDYEGSKYITIQGPTAHTYDATRMTNGISQALLLRDFIRPSNGFISKTDLCKFGVEVFVADTIPTSIGRLSTLYERTSDNFTWTINKFSMIRDSKCSDDFDMEERSWELEIYPQGWGAGKRESLTLFLSLLDFSDLTGGKKLYVDTTVRIINQLSEEHEEDSISGWYSKECSSICAIHLLSLSDLHNKDKGFKMDDQVIVEVEFKLVMLVDEA